jgi:hypothetical protein
VYPLSKKTQICGAFTGKVHGPNILAVTVLPWIQFYITSKKLISLNLLSNRLDVPSTLSATIDDI